MPTIPTDTGQPTNKLVDLEILGVTYDAAKARLDVVRAQEKRTNGVAKTTLADVGRAAIAGWRPPTRAKTGGQPQRVSRAGMPARAFRFGMPAAIYDRARDRMHASGVSVASVVHDALESFARTGTY